MCSSFFVLFSFHRTYKRFDFDYTLSVVKRVWRIHVCLDNVMLFALAFLFARCCFFLINETIAINAKQTCNRFIRQYKLLSNDTKKQHILSANILKRRACDTHRHNEYTLYLMYSTLFFHSEGKNHINNEALNRCHEICHSIENFKFCDNSRQHAHRKTQRFGWRSPRWQTRGKGSERNWESDVLMRRILAIIIYVFIPYLAYKCDDMRVNYWHLLVNQMENN